MGETREAGRESSPDLNPHIFHIAIK